MLLLVTLLLLLWRVAGGSELEFERVVVTFRSLYDAERALYWEPGDGAARVEVARIPAYGEVRQSTVRGQRFSVASRGAQPVSDEVMVFGPDNLRVRCGEKLVFRVRPDWSPRGAARLIDLVMAGHFNGVAVNRFVPRFLAQFGIRPGEAAPSPIKDDDPPGVAFEPGMVAFAGNGKDSRSAEIFIVLPEASEAQLEAFGTSPWETPVARLEGDVPLDALSNPYGDMPPWGNGPDPSRLARPDGYEYLREHFPDIKYLDACTVLPQEKEPLPPAPDEEEEDDEFKDFGEAPQSKGPPPPQSDHDDDTFVPPKSRLGVLGPPLAILALSCSFDFMRRRAKRISRERHLAAAAAADKLA